MLGAVREEGADGDPQLVQWVGESGVECGGQPSSQGLEGNGLVDTLRTPVYGGVPQPFL